MKCPNCGHENEGGKFCINCGSPLESVAQTTAPSTEEQVTVSEQPDAVQTTAPEPEAVVTSEEVVESPEPTTTLQQTEQPKQEKPEKKNDFSDQLAKVFTNFGHFFMTLIKQPSQAKKANHNDLFSAIITMAAFSLIVALSIFLPQAILSRTNWFYTAPSFVQDFVLPLLLFVIIFGGTASLTFAAAKIVKLDFSYPDVIGKYGAYLLPYALVYIAGIILSLAQLPAIPGILLVIGILGPIFVIPALILFEKNASGFDRIYTLLGLYFVVLLVIGLVIQSVIQSLIGGMIGDLSNFFR